jgi:D-alanyl-D-alanine carboxypeptidase/D-alanyl-D-alanine-endopeptidase (penicillin-binding protein 4)
MRFAGRSRHRGFALGLALSLAVTLATTAFAAPPAALTTGGSLERPRAQRASPAANRSPPSSDQRERPSAKWRATRDRALRHTLDRLLGEPAAASGFWGVYVYSLDRQRVLYDRNGERWFTPASNAKLFALAAALELLGPQYRFHTVVEAGTAPDAAGVITGDLTLVGAGDPSLSGRVYPYQYRAPATPTGALQLPYDPMLAADRLAQQLVARGVTRIAGAVIGDDAYFADDRYGRGWAADDLAQDYGAPVGALTMNDNQRFVEIVPGAVAGAPAQVRLVPGVGAALIDNHVVTGHRTAVTVSGWPGALRLDGEVAVGSAGGVEAIPVRDPALYAAELLRQALLDHGITVVGAARARHRAQGVAMGAPRAGFTLATWESPPLWEILQTTAKVSENLHAELLLRLLGKLRGAPGASGEDGEVAAGERVVAAFEHRAGLAHDDAKLVDGSGLSRLDLVTPAGVVRLLRYMNGQPEASAWRSFFPVAGEDGTLVHRFRGTAAAGVLTGKTGSMTHVHCLSGYVTTRHGEHLAFAIFADNQGQPGHSELDRLAVALVE